MADPHADFEPSFFRGRGRMGALLRHHAWADTPLGPPVSWPAGLTSALDLCLDSAFPIAIYWGPELSLLYNDAWRPILGDKHPWALGRPAREVWPEIWSSIAPVFRTVIDTGSGVFNGDSLLAMHRHGYVEECYFDYTFNPIRGAGDRVDGIFNVVIETTYRVINERRSRLQRDFAARLTGGTNEADVIRRAAAALEQAPLDVPFAVFFERRSHGFALAGATGALPPDLGGGSAARQRGTSLVTMLLVDPDGLGVEGIAVRTVGSSRSIEGNTGCLAP